MNTTIQSEFFELIDKCNVSPSNIFEIGAADGSDSEYLRQHFQIDQENVYCFEPVPSSYQGIVSRYPSFKTFQMVIGNKTEKVKFWCHYPTSDISSIGKRINLYQYTNNTYQSVELDGMRMEDFFTKYNIDHADICKIDVEGYSYEVLEGFGDKIKLVKFFHIEGEESVLYENQKLFEDFKKLLESKGFTMTDYFKLGTNSQQCDSIWVRSDLL